MGTLNLISNVTKTNVPSQKFEKKRLESIEKTNVLAKELDNNISTNNQEQSNEVNFDIF